MICLREAAKKSVFSVARPQRPPPPLELSGKRNFFLSKSSFKKSYFFLVARPLPPPPPPPLSCHDTKGIWLPRVQSQIGLFLSEKTYFFCACATCSELPSNISSMVQTALRSQGIGRKTYCKEMYNTILLFVPEVLFHFYITI